MATDMTTDTIRISAVILAPPERIYAAWLDSEEHSAITHSTAGVEPWVGGRHSAWGGSIRGTTVELQPNRRIVQTWWASDFPPGAEESRVEVLFEPVPDGTLVTINHTGLPQGRGHRYEDGWKDFYLDNMRDYFLAHPSLPMREESPAPAGQTRMDLPAASAPGRAMTSATRGTGGVRAASAKAAKKPVKAKKAAAKKKTARKPVARKVAKKAKSKPKRKPVKARKPSRKPSRKSARSKAPKARKSGGRARSKRGR